MIRSTTILCVRRAEQVAMAGDGQVSLNTTIMKHQARKVRKLYHQRIVAGFAGAAADALRSSRVSRASWKHFRAV